MTTTADAGAPSSPTPPGAGGPNPSIPVAPGTQGKTVNTSAKGRLYFPAGAAHDPDNTGYIAKILKAFDNAGLKGAIDIAAHGSKFTDLLFTTGPDSWVAADKNVVLDRRIVTTRFEYFQRSCSESTRNRRAIESLRIQYRKRNPGSGCLEARWRWKHRQLLDSHRYSY
jgi:hypothetical protein